MSARENVKHFADHISKHIFLNKFPISSVIALKFVSYDRIDNKSG